MTLNFSSLVIIKFVVLFFYMLIRLATVNDIPETMGLLSEVVPPMNASGNFQWDNNYPNAKIFAEDVAHGKLWLAEIKNKIAGISAITTDQDPEYAQVGWDISETAIVTHRLAVNIHYRGLGVAEALLQKAEQEALRRGIKTLRVDTNTKNTATQKLFPKMRYVFSGEIGLSYRPGLRFYCYEKRLD